MANYLIGLHAGLGEIGAFLFLWLFVELLNPTPKRLKRAKTIALLGTLFIILAWFAGGYYYVTTYSSEVKPIIKEGPSPWAHGIFTETKEHVFLFLPFLGVLVTGLLFNYGTKLQKDKKIRTSILSLSMLIVLLALAMAAMGYLISTGVRAALEAGV